MIVCQQCDKDISDSPKFHTYVTGHYLFQYVPKTKRSDGNSK